MTNPTLRCIDTDGTVYTRQSARPYQVVLVTTQTEAAWYACRAERMAYLEAQVRQYAAAVLVLQALERGESRADVVHTYVAAAILRDMKVSGGSYNMMKAGVKTELDSLFYHYDHPIMERWTSAMYQDCLTSAQQRLAKLHANATPSLEIIVTWHHTRKNAEKELAKRLAWGEKTYRYLPVEAA